MSMGGGRYVVWIRCSGGCAAGSSFFQAARCPLGLRQQTRTFGFAILVLLVGTVSGCGGPGARGGAVSGQAEVFERALHAGDNAAACALLAPGTRSEVEDSAQKPCAVALGEEPLPSGGAVRAVEVYGRQAMVTLERDTLFLSQFPGGWRVVAAGCLPEAGKPYQCQVKGG
jgi:hypothetical protein